MTSKNLSLYIETHFLYLIICKENTVFQKSILFEASKSLISKKSYNFTELMKIGLVSL